MPLDDVAVGLFKVIGKLIVYLVIDVLLEIVFYFLGKAVLQIVTLGKYPPKIDKEHSHGFVQFVGFLVIVLIITGLYFIKA